MSCSFAPCVSRTRRLQSVSGTAVDGRDRRAAMTFHAEAFVPESIAADSVIAPPSDDVVRIAFTPLHADAPCVVDVRFSLTGAAGAPVVVVQGGISATRDAAGAGGWWNAIAGDGRAIDTTRLRVLSIEWLDRADFRDEASGERADLRAIASDDQADAIAAVADALGIASLHAFVGASYGAMVGLAFAARHGARLARVVAIGGAHRAHPLSIAIRNVQREIVRLAARHGDVETGLALARRLAMTTYRSEREFAERCSAGPEFADGRFRFAEEAWLGAAGERFVRCVGAGRFLDLSESIDLHAVAPESIRVASTLIGIASDRVVPLADVCELQRRAGAVATLHVVDSRYGHDAFLKDADAIAPLIADAIDARSHP
jgi:homoserine O-acetyltransferase